MKMMTPWNKFVFFRLPLCPRLYFAGHLRFPRPRAYLHVYPGLR